MAAHETHSIRDGWRRFRDQYHRLCSVLLGRTQASDGPTDGNSPDHIEANYRAAVHRYLELVQNNGAIGFADSNRVQCLDEAKQEVARWRELYLVQNTAVDQ